MAFVLGPGGKGLCAAPSLRGAEPPWSAPLWGDGQMTVRARSCGSGGQDQNLRKSGWSSCHHTSTTLPIMLEPLIGPQYRLSHESDRLSPSM
jgi:hypothetical protein